MGRASCARSRVQGVPCTTLAVGMRSGFYRVLAALGFTAEVAPKEDIGKPPGVHRRTVVLLGGEYQ